MKKLKKTKDFIDESDFTLGMLDTPSRPENDSPGDSDSDLKSEIYMGIEFSDILQEKIFYPLNRLRKKKKPILEP